jgi:hypothetical protein
MIALKLICHSDVSYNYKFYYYDFQNADIMFFVIDKETRGISSLIEVGYLVGEFLYVVMIFN